MNKVQEAKLKLHFTCGKETAKEEFDSCVRLYGQTPLKDASAHIALGGDGTTLDVLRKQVEQNIDVPIFALNYGTVGWLTNQKCWENLPDRIFKAQRFYVNPLQLEATLYPDGHKVRTYAFNEFSFFRGPSMQAVDLNVTTKDWIRKIRGDGVMIATPLGSNAYLKSAGGPKLPQGSNMLAIHANNATEPFSIVVPSDTVVAVGVCQHEKRPVRIECDSKVAIDSVSRAVVKLATHRRQILLFDKERKDRFSGKIFNC